MSRHLKQNSEQQTANGKWKKERKSQQKQKAISFSFSELVAGG